MAKFNFLTKDSPYLINSAKKWWARDFNSHVNIFTAGKDKGLARYGHSCCPLSARTSFMSMAPSAFLSHWHPATQCPLTMNGRQIFLLLNNRLGCFKKFVFLNVLQAGNKAKPGIFSSFYNSATTNHWLGSLHHALVYSSQVSAKIQSGFLAIFEVEIVGFTNVQIHHC